MFGFDTGIVRFGVSPADNRTDQRWAQNIDSESGEETAFFSLHTNYAKSLFQNGLAEHPPQ
jgi:hypothetical protein